MIHYRQVLVLKRIAQLVVAPVCIPEIEYCEELSVTERGESGFGSTGRV
jgi:dUTPase